MSFGEKVGSVDKYLDESGNQAERSITFIPKNSTMKVRFLEEPSDWVKYTEVYSIPDKKSWPNPEEGMPGFIAEQDNECRLTWRFLAPILLVGVGDRDLAEVKSLILPSSLMNGQNGLFKLFQRRETLTDRDFELWKEGTGLDTEYGFLAEGVVERDLSDVEMPDPLKDLEDWYMDIWGDESAPVTKDEVKSKVEDKGDGESAESFAEDLDEMSMGQLRQVARELNINDHQSRAKLVEAILDKQF